MLALQNRTPYTAERAFVRDKRGANYWVVAVKATYTFSAPGNLELAERQLPPVLAPEHWADPGTSSLRYESDLGLMKPSTDVLINGSAHAPRERAASEVQVRLRVDRVAKTLDVVGPRTFRRDRMSDPLPFKQLPLRYEAAFGGIDRTSKDPREHLADMRNPVGVGFATQSAHLDGTRAPSVCYARSDPARGGPAGFSAIASHWSPRRELGGTYDDAWNSTQRPLLPLDWREESLLSSPADQRVDRYLVGGEPVELINMSPEGRLLFSLPKVYLTFSTYFGSKIQEHRSRLVTVIIEPDDRRVLMVWRTALEVPLRQIDYLDKTVIRQKPYLQ